MKSKCNSCGYEFDTHSCLDNPRLTPRKGDFSICFKCTSICQFDEKLNLVRLTDEELNEFKEEDEEVYNTLIKTIKIIEKSK